MGLGSTPGEACMRALLGLFNNLRMCVGLIEIRT